MIAHCTMALCKYFNLHILFKIYVSNYCNALNVNKYIWIRIEKYVLSGVFHPYWGIHYKFYRSNLNSIGQGIRCEEPVSMSNFRHLVHLNSDRVSVGFNWNAGQLVLNRSKKKRLVFSQFFQISFSTVRESYNRKQQSAS